MGKPSMALQVLLKVPCNSEEKTEKSQVGDWENQLTHTKGAIAFSSFCFLLSFFTCATKETQQRNRETTDADNRNDNSSSSSNSSSESAQPQAHQRRKRKWLCLCLSWLCLPPSLICSDVSLLLFFFFFFFDLCPMFWVSMSMRSIISWTLVFSCSNVSIRRNPKSRNYWSLPHDDMIERTVYPFFGMLYRTLLSNIYFK